MPIDSINTQRPQLEGGLLLSILRNAGQLAGKNKLRAEDSLSSGPMDPTAAPRYKEDWWDSLYGGQANRINAAGGIDAYNRATALKDTKELGKFQTGEKKELRKFDTDEDTRGLLQKIPHMFDDFAKRSNLSTSLQVQGHNAMGDADSTRRVKEFGDMTAGVVDRTKQLGQTQNALEIDQYKALLPLELQRAYEMALNSGNAQRMNDARQMAHSALMEQATAAGDAGLLKKLQLMKATTEAGTGVKVADYADKTLPQQQAINDLMLKSGLDEATAKSLLAEDRLAGSKFQQTRDLNQQAVLTEAGAAAAGKPVDIAHGGALYFPGSRGSVTRGFDANGQPTLSSAFPATHASMLRAAEKLGAPSADAARQGSPVKSTATVPTQAPAPTPMQQEPPSGGYEGSPFQLFMRRHNNFMPATATGGNWDGLRNDPKWRAMNGLPASTAIIPQ